MVTNLPTINVPGTSWMSPPLTATMAQPGLVAATATFAGDHGDHAQFGEVDTLFELNRKGLTTLEGLNRQIQALRVGESLVIGRCAYPEKADFVAELGQLTMDELRSEIPEDVTVRLSGKEHPAVSRRHAEIRRTSHGFEVRDLASANGIHKVPDRAKQHWAQLEGRYGVNTGEFWIMVGATQHAWQLPSDGWQPLQSGDVLYLGNPSIFEHPQSTAKITIP